MMLSELEDCHLQSLCNMLPFFDRILHPKKTQFLFPAVWKVLSTQNITKHGVISNRITETEIFKMRETCKSWCTAIDNFINDPEKSNLPFRSSIGETSFPLLDYQDFMHHFDATHAVSDRSPFICNTGSLKISPPYRRYGAQWKLLLELLSKYGRHLQRLTIQLQDHYVVRLEIYLQVRDILTNLPNLKSLIIDYVRLYTPGECYQNFSEPARGLTEFCRHIRTNALPNLKFLESISFSGVFTPLLHELLHKNVQVSALEIKSCPIVKNRGFEYQQLKMNLAKLIITIHSEKEFKGLEQSQNNWKLTTATISFGEKVYIKWPRLFKFLENKWRSTLQSLNICMPGSENAKEKRQMAEWSLALQLNLPKVTELKIKLKNLAVIDFILPMQQLRVLSVNTCFNTEEESKENTKMFRYLRRQQKIKFLCCKQSLLSNIRHQLPSLEQVIL